MNKQSKKMKKKMFTLDLKLANGEELSEFDKLMLETPIPTPNRRNELVEGIVVNKTKGGYLVDIGQKCDSEVLSKECSDELETGKTYTFLVFSEADEEGGVQLSYDRAKSWSYLQSLVESGGVGQAKVYAIQTNRSGRVAGVKAVISGVRAFVPRSEILYRGNLEDLLETEVAVKVLEAEPTKGRFGQLILSHKQVLELRQDEQLVSINVGDHIEGVVAKLITPGVLVDLGGDVTGLIHRSELSGNRYVEPASVLSVGDRVEVKVLNVNMEKRQVSLSRRAVLQASFFEQVKEGDVIEGVVARFQDYGAFVTVGDSVDGLLHISELLTAGSGNSAVTETLKVGDKVRVKVKSIDVTSQRLSLTRKGLPSATGAGSEKVA